MFKNIITGLMLILLMSCEVPKPKDRPTPSADPQTKIVETEVVLIGKYRSDFGFLYIYTYGKDTIYVVTGGGSTYPISMQVK